MDPFLFIVGCARSGTTLLRVMFDAHPQIAVARESHFIPTLAERYADATTFPTDAFLADVFAHPRFPRWDLPAETVVKRFAAEPVSGFADAIRLLYRTLADAEGKPRYGDKTPKYVRSIDLLGGLFPESRFIHIVRDGRSVVASFLRTDIGPRQLEPGARLWRDSVVEGRAAGERLGSARYTEVTYEALVTEPERELRRLAAFADLPYDPAMTQYYERDAAHALAQGRHHAELVRPPTPGLRDWRQELTPEQLAAFEQIAGHALDEFGYPRVGEASAGATSASRPGV